jgi:phosphoserine phosphatase
LSALHTLWPDEARRRIEDALERAPAGSVAAFDFDNTMITGDVGETLHYRLCAEGLYAFTDAFWAQIHPDDGRDRIRARYDPRRPEDEAVLDLQAVFIRRLQREGLASAYRWAVTLHVDLPVNDLMRIASNHFEREQALPREVQVRRAPGGEVLRMQRGIERREPMEALAGAVRDAGLVDWVISATNEWAIRAIAPQLGFTAERCIGNACIEEGGVVTAARREPVTWRAGKVEALDTIVGQRAWLSVGDSWTDAELLESAMGLAVLIDRGDVSLRDHAVARGWLVVDARWIERRPTVEEPNESG